MSREVTLDTREMGKVRLYLIYSYAGVWEEHWRPLQGHDVGKLLATATHETVEQAMLRYSRPLVKALGLNGKGLLHKLPSRECALAKPCTLHVAKNCLSTAKGMPWCFEPSGIDEPLRPLVAELVRLWREEVYVVVVEEPPDAR